LIQKPELNIDSLLKCYHQYMHFVVDSPPNQKIFLQNLEAKMKDDDFKGDMTALIRPTEQYDHMIAYEIVKTRLIENLE
jgi:hypothetical protein